MKPVNFSLKRFFAIATLSACINILLLVQPIYFLQVFDHIIISGNRTTLVMLTALAASLLLAYVLLDVFRRQYLIALGTQLDASISQAIVTKEIEATSADQQFSATLSDLKSLKTFLSGSGATAIMDAPWSIPFLIVIYSFHPQLGVLALGGILLVAAVSLLGQIISYQHFAGLQLNTRQAETNLRHVFSHHEIAHGVGMREAFLSRWNEHNLIALEADNQFDTGLGATQAVSRGLRMIMQILMIGLAATLVLEGQAGYGILIASTLLFGKFLAPVETLVSSLPQISAAISAYRRLSALNLKEANAGLFKATKEVGAMKVNNVSVHSKDENQRILRGVNLHLRRGESLALIGPSGAGKTTLARTMVGSLEATSGEVLLNHVPLARWPNTQRYKVVGYMPQNGALFEGTIAENIARLQSPDPEKLVLAAHTAQVAEMINALPDGYQTRISAGGFPLSAGEQQRIALARAVYGSPQIVILDEPNASVDAAGERALHTCLQKLKEQAVTVIIITHRPDILTGVEKVAVMRKGRIESIGNAEHMLRALNIVQQSGIPACDQANEGEHHE